jgi:hypothetical protein
MFSGGRFANRPYASGGVEDFCSVGVPPAVAGESRSCEGAGRMPTLQRAGRPRYILRLRYVGGLGFLSCVARPAEAGLYIKLHAYGLLPTVLSSRREKA